MPYGTAYFISCTFPFLRRKETALFDFTIALQANSKTPLYEQLYQAIADQIRKGNLKYPDLLPSKRALEEMMKVSHSTIETAYSLLSAEGYIESIPRVGYRVNRRIPMPFTVLSMAKPGMDRIRSVSGSKTQEPKEENADRYLSFSTGDVDTSLFPYSSWARIYKEVVYQNPDLLQRGEAVGDLHLRKTLAAFLNQYRGVVCGPQQIIVGSGAEYLLGLLIQLFDEDITIGLEDPGYPAVRRILTNYGRFYLSLDMDQKGLKEEQLYQKKIDLVYVTPSHQFPMGTTMPAERRSRILSWAEKCGGYIIEDDYDSEFRYRSRPLKALQGLDKAGRVIYMGTFSRSLAPSIRVAFMVLPQELMKRYQQKFGKQSCTVSRFEQQVLAEFIDRGLYVRHLRRCTNLYKKKEARLIEDLTAIKGSFVSGQGAGLHFLLHLPSVSREGLIRAAQTYRLQLHFLDEYAEKTQMPYPILVIGFGGLSFEQMSQNAQALTKAVETAQEGQTLRSQ